MNRQIPAASVLFLVWPSVISCYDVYGMRRCRFAALFILFHLTYCQPVSLVHFKGEYHNRVDHKGRVCLPSRLRAILAAAAGTESDSAPVFTLLRGLDTCLYLYPEMHWRRIEERLSRINSFSDSGRKVLRRFLRFAEDISPDAQHRLSLPARLRDWAGIKPGSTAVFLGSGERIEIWAPDQLDAADEALDTATYQHLFEVLMSDPEPPGSL